MAKLFINFAIIALFTLAVQSDTASTVQIVSLEDQTSERSLEAVQEISADERINLLEKRLDDLAKTLSDNLQNISQGLCGNCSESSGTGETDLQSYVTNWNVQIQKHYKEMFKRKTDKIIGFPENCEEATRATRKSDVYYIAPEPTRPPVTVYCDDTIDNGGWTVIQRRVDGSVDFNRNWADYKKGFGDLRGEFFIGLDKLRALTTTTQELYILMQSFTGEIKYAKYSSFAIGSESEKYSLKKLGLYRGTAGDSLRQLLNAKFQTSETLDYYNPNCASTYQAGWWMRADCSQIGTVLNVLNDVYMPDKNNDGIQWETFGEGRIGLKFTQMMIRPSVTA